MSSEVTKNPDAHVTAYLDAEEMRATEMFEPGTSSVRFMRVGGHTVGAWVENDPELGIVSYSIDLQQNSAV